MSRLKNKNKAMALAIATVVMAQNVQPILALDENTLNLGEIQVTLEEIQKNVEEETKKYDETDFEEDAEEEMTTETEEVEEAIETESITADLRIMATTDLHANIMDYDYYTDKQDSIMGLSRVATLIEEARKEADKNENVFDKIDNVILVDNGDTIQGNPLANVFAMNEATKVKPGEKYPVYEALDILGYDATTLGNHEFNYGLDFLNQITDKSVMSTDVINANVTDMNGKPLFNQYKVIEEIIIDSNGNEQTVKIGLTGFVPPQILNWDKQHLDGKVKVEDIKTSADKVVKTLKETEEVDVVVALAHTGTGSSDEHIPGAENAAYQLTKVEGLDVVVAGHSHSTVNTTMNGVQVVQPSNWGKELGIVDLKLKQVDGAWVVNDEASKIERRNVKVLSPANNTVISENTRLKAAHEKTVEFVNGDVGTTTKDLNSFFSLVADDASVDLVANAQKWYAEKKIKEGQDELQAYKNLPILSAAAPFKAGGRDFTDSTYFVDIKAGGLKIKDLSSLYIYDNTVSIIKINGAQVKEWLEMTSGMFNQIDANSNEEQQLFNTSYRSYNFDSIQGVTYEIDVTKPAKYDGSGNTINPYSERIVNLEFNGKPLDMNQEFLVVTNNYRAGGNFPGVRDAELVYSSADENRQAIMDYIQETGEITPEADNNWKIKSVDTDAKVVFNSHTDAKDYIDNHKAISINKELENNITQYTYDLKNGSPNSDTVEVQLLSFNDLHGQYDVDSKYGGGIANLSAHLKSLQGTNKNTLTMSAGDAVGGSPAVAALKQDQPTLEMMREMNVNVVTTGNHEYDEGINELARLIQGGTHSSGIEWNGSEDLNWITANVVANKDLKFGNKDIKKGEPILNPYTIKEFDGAKIGIIGIVTTDTAKKVIPDGIKDVDFIDEVQAIDKYTEELTKQGVKTIVVLSHVPTKTDFATGDLIDLVEASDVYDIAQKVNGEVDVIIGADNHQYANSVVKRTGKDDIIVTQAYSKGTNIGDIDLKINKTTGDVEYYDIAVHEVKPGVIEPDATVAKMVEQAREDVKHLLERVVGVAEEDILREVVGNSGETELGRMIAEAQLWAARSKGVDADISMMNIGGVRADLSQGDVTYEDIYTVQPFGNDLTKVTLTGAQLKTFLEYGQRIDRMTQIAGFKYEWHEEVVDGNKVVRVDSINLEDGTPITDDMELTVAMNIYMAQGGDGLSVLGNLNYEVLMGDLEAFELYTEAHTPLKKIDVLANPNMIKLDEKPEVNPPAEEGFGPDGDVTPELDYDNNNGGNNNGGSNNGNGNNNNNGGSNNGGNNNGNGNNNNNGGSNNGGSNNGNGNKPTNPKQGMSA